MKKSDIEMKGVFQDTSEMTMGQCKGTWAAFNAQPGIIGERYVFPFHSPSSNTLVTSFNVPDGWERFSPLLSPKEMLLPDNKDVVIYPLGFAGTADILKRLPRPDFPSTASLKAAFLNGEHERHANAKFVGIKTNEDRCTADIQHQDVRPLR